MIRCLSIATVLTGMAITLNAQNMKKEEVPQNISAFPVGKANTGFEQYFTGRHFPVNSKEYLSLFRQNCPGEAGPIA